MRSLLAFWIGGAASSAPATPAQAGYSSLLGFWIGGAGSAGVEIPPVIPPTSGGGGSAGYGNRTWISHQAAIQQAIQNDDNELLEVIQIIMACEDIWRA